MYLMIRDS